jgi:hypothetical protein
MRRSALSSTFLGLMTLLLAMAYSGGAEALAADDLLGRWCGADSDYEFTREQLTVKFHSGQSQVLPIRSIEVLPDRIRVYWNIERPGVKPEDLSTSFYDFDAAGRNMAQMANKGGDMGPRIPFHRC